MPGYMTALYTPDFWSPGFQPLSEPTFEAIAKHNGGWVTVSSVWSYGTIQPLPSIESRPLVSDTVLTPRPDIVEQARKAHEAGLKVMLAPQFNMEMSPGGLDALHGDEEWWDTWLAAAEEMWRWNADVAEEIGAEALVLPGYVFHVFAPPDQFPSLDAFETFDEKLVGLVSRVRAKYSGKIVISGGVLDSDAPGLADMVGVTTYDTGAPSLANDASVDEWHVAYEALLTEKVDPIYERWSKPVLFYTINIPRAGGATAAAEADQARQLEGILRAVADRPWIAGSFMWSYRMVDAPTSADDGLRGRLGEAVMARYYELFAGAK